MGFELALLLMFIFQLCSTQNTYYIRPTPDIPCPTSEVCCIFSDCVDHVDQFFASNTTLVFLSGNYILETSVRVRDVSNLTLIGDPAYLPQVTSRITCNSNPNAYFAFQDVSELYISALAFDSCAGITTDDASIRAISLDSTYGSKISNCMFLNSRSTATEVSSGLSGGALIVASSGDIVISDCVFENNSISTRGGVFIFKSDVIFTGNVFVNNTAVQGGGLLLLSSNATLTGNSFIRNYASVVGGGLAFFWSNVTFLGETNFTNNTAAAVGFGGGLLVQLSRVEFNGDANFEGNSAGILGGAILINNNSTVQFNGRVRLESSRASYGAAVAATESDLTMDHIMYVENNIATYGAGIYLREASMALPGKAEFNNNTANFGGAIYASSSDIYFEGSTNFTRNSAINGGGLLLTSGSQMYLFPSTAVQFRNNQARETGGAIEVEDTNALVYCVDPIVTQLVSPNECFFQLQNEMIQTLSDVTAVLSFENNVAVMGGGDLYGGTVGNCRLPNASCVERLTCSSAEVFELSAGVESQTLSISSVPLRVCMCSNTIPDCSNSQITVQVFPGQALEISATAFGQRSGSTAAVIQTQLLQNNIQFCDLEYTQRTNGTCTNLHYTILTSLQDVEEEVTLFAEGPCESDENSLVLNVKVLPCPPGFQQSDQICVCDEQLNDFTDVCNIDNGTILRPRGAEFWVGYDSNSQELIVNSQCPFDYCSSDQRYVSVTNSDTQCNYNRTGVLCGDCSGTTSLILGSSRCLQCSNSYLALIIAFALAGVALVLFLFILKLTVAVGTVNGLIFYANLVQVNSSIFYPPGMTNVLTVFIGWINLDLGIETCFYNGMDAYAKTWLQFVFPIYVWILVTLMIIISHFSQKMTKMLGSNPIAVLATLFLLSYAKVLRTIIAALSVSYLRYPGDVNVAVWSFDGNIEYLTGKHIPLFLIALLALLLLFLPYTLFLFLAQWIQTLQGKLEWGIFSWLNKSSVRAFLDAYNAPYANQHRYWTGLLLLIRCILFLIFATVGDDSANLLAICSIITGLITLAFIMGVVYKNWYLGVLDVSFLLNLVILAAATYHVKVSGGSQAAVTFTLLSIVFMSFVGIILFHIFLQIRNTNLCEKLKFVIVQNMQLPVNSDQTSPQENEAAFRNSNSVPMSYVDLREPLLDEN